MPASNSRAKTTSGPSWSRGKASRSAPDSIWRCSASSTSADPHNPGTIQPSGLTHLGQQVAWVWQELPVPVIAAVHGHALGGGLQIALGADIRVVHPDTQLSVREVHYGLVPDMTGTFSCPASSAPTSPRS